MYQFNHVSPDTIKPKVGMPMLPRAVCCIKHFFLDLNFSNATDNMGWLLSGNLHFGSGGNVQSAIPFTAELHA